jgi:hypothetical protein
MLEVGDAEIGFAMGSSVLLNSLVATRVGSFGNSDAEGGGSTSAHGSRSLTVKRQVVGSVTLRTRLV